MDGTAIVAIIMGFIGIVGGYIGKRKIDSDNRAKELKIQSDAETARIDNEKNAENARIKIEADAAAIRLEIEKNAENARIKTEADAAAVKLELETAAAKVKLELETAAALQLAETERIRQAAAAQIAKEVAEQRAKDDIELEGYREKRAVREEQTAHSLALAAQLQTELLTGLKSLEGGQKRMNKIVVETEKRIIGSGASATAGLTEAIQEVLRGIVKLTSGQVDQTTALSSIQQAVQGLADFLKETPSTEAAGEAVEEMADEIAVVVDAVEKSTPQVEMRQ